MPCLRTGELPQPPPAFDPSAHAPTDFAPPLKPESRPKVLASGRAPEPPEAFEPADGDSFDPPLSGPAPAVVSKPKVLANGLLPMPPAPFHPSAAAHIVFDPPISLATDS